MFMEEMQAPLEALLFVRGEPVTAVQLREIMQVDAYVQKLAEVQDRKLTTPTLETLSIVAF